MSLPRCGLIKIQSCVDAIFLMGDSPLSVGAQSIEKDGIPGLGSEQDFVRTGFTFPLLAGPLFFLSWRFLHAQNHRKPLKGRNERILLVLCWRLDDPDFHLFQKLLPKDEVFSLTLDSVEWGLAGLLGTENENK